MTASRRSRRTPPLSAPEERLRALGLDSSPALPPPRDHAPRPAPAPAVVLPRPPYAVDGSDSPYLPEGRASVGSGHWSSPSPPGPLWNGTAGPPDEAVLLPEDPLDPETAPTVRITPDALAVPPVTEAPAARRVPPDTAPPDAASSDTAPENHRNGPSPWTSELTGPDAVFATALGEGVPEQRHREGPREEHSTSWDPGGATEPGAHASGGRSGVVTPSVPAPSTAHAPTPGPDVPSAPEGSLGAPAAPGSAETPEPPPDEDAGGRHQRGAAAVRPPSGYTELTPEAPDSVLDRVAERWGARSSLSRRAVVTLLVLGLLAVAGALLVVRDRPEEVVVTELASQASPAGRDGAEQPGSGDDDAGSGAAEEPGADVVVHVGGEVVRPGLYTMPGGSRVADAVEEAGGPLPEADLDLVNLARPLTDGERVLVGVPQPDGASGEGPEGGGPLVNLNLAGQSELETLPGIGQKKAQQILAHRESLGGTFGSTEDLLGVDGIAEKTFRSLEPHVTVG